MSELFFFFKYPLQPYLVRNEEKIGLFVDVIICEWQHIDWLKKLFLEQPQLQRVCQIYKYINWYITSFDIAKYEEEKILAKGYSPLHKCHTSNPRVHWTCLLFSRPVRSQGLLYKQPCHWLIKWVSEWAFSSHSFMAPPRPNG